METRKKTAMLKYYEGACEEDGGPRAFLECVAFGQGGHRVAQNRARALPSDVLFFDLNPCAGQHCDRPNSAHAEDTGTKSTASLRPEPGLWIRIRNEPHDVRTNQTNENLVGKNLSAFIIIYTSKLARALQRDEDSALRSVFNCFLAPFVNIIHNHRKRKKK